MPRVHVEGSLATLWVNLALYAATLLAAILARPKPRLKPPHHPPSAKAKLGRRGAAHALLVGFALLRVVWAAYLLASEDKHAAHEPCQLPGSMWEFWLDSLCSFTFLAATATVIARLADTLLVGYRSSRRLWVALRLSIYASLAYEAFVLGAVVVTELPESGHAGRVAGEILDALIDEVQPQLLGILCLALLVALVAVFRLYKRQAMPEALTRFRFARRAATALALLSAGSFLVRSVLWLTYSHSTVRLYVWFSLTKWLPELLPTLGLLLLLRLLSATHLPRARASSHFGPLFSTATRAQLLDYSGSTFPPLDADTSCRATQVVAEKPSTQVVYVGVPRDGGEMRVVETLRESPLGWSVPAAWLSLVAKERCSELRRLLSEFSSAQARVLASRGGDAAGDRSAGGELETVDLLERLKLELRGEQKQPELSWRRAQLQRLEAYLLDLLRVLPLLQRARYRGLSFKPSTAKKDQSLRFVPTNLQIQRMDVYMNGPDCSDFKTEGSYVFVTAGAPAAHALSFSSGGIVQLDERIERSEREQAETVDPKYAQYLCRKVGMLRMARSAREEIAISQALPAIAAIFLSRLEQEVENQPPGCSGGSALDVWSRLGFIIGWESLLSTYGSEEHMLGDTYGAVKRIAGMRLGVALVCEGEAWSRSRGSGLGDAIRASASAYDDAPASSRAPDGGLAPPPSLSLAAPRPMRCLSGVPHPEDACTTLENSFEGFAANAAECGVILARGATGDMLLTLRVSRPTWEKLPSSLQNGAPVSVKVALFSQGINAQQTVANAMGGTELQKRINAGAARVLRTYWESMRGMLAEPQVEVDQLLAALERTVSTSRSEKSVELITLSERIIWRLKGGRITSCKSAKDRTSMAVTAEQAQMLVERHGLEEADAIALTNEMRAYGVRWHNMRQNVEHGLYAFNWLQQRLLPQVYRAPVGTYSSRSAT